MSDFRDEFGLSQPAAAALKLLCSLCVFVAGFAWLVFLPSVGLLYVFGYLSRG